MVIDTSAILAILLDEPERRAFNEAIEAAESRVLSAATLIDASAAVDVNLSVRGSARQG